MTKVKNISAGPRSILSTTGFVLLEAGQSRDIDVAEGETAGEWFVFDGPEETPIDTAIDDLATATHTDLGERFAALTARAEAAELQVITLQADLDTANETIAELSKDSGEPSDIKTAIDMLDPANETHWTSAGLPAVDAVKEILGRDITRAEINEAAPDFMRPTN